MDFQEFVQDPEEEKLDDLEQSLNGFHNIKYVLNYDELLLEIDACISSEPKKIFDCIIYDPTRVAEVLIKLKDLFVYLRDDKNEELKAMFTEESSIPAPIIFYSLKTIFQLHRIVQNFIKTYINEYYDNTYIYPYLCSLGDVLDVIAYRHLKLFLNKYRYTPNIKNYLANIPAEDLFCFSRKACETNKFSKTLQEKLGVDLDVSHLLKPDDNECAICGVGLDTNSDFAVLDTCNHLMCTDCAEVTLMGKVVDLIPLEEETDDEDGDDHRHMVVLGKVPKCPCCRREVGQWTTTHIMKFYQDNECKFWDFDNTNLLPQNPLSLFDIFQNCIKECLLINYSVPFVWMTIIKHCEGLRDARFYSQKEHKNVNKIIVMLLELPQAKIRTLQNDIKNCNMAGIESIFNRWNLSNELENNPEIRMSAKESESLRKLLIDIILYYVCK